MFYLELRDRPDPGQASRPPSGLRLVERTDLETVRRLTLTIGTPYRWPSLEWDRKRWDEYLARSDVRHWTAELAGSSVGLVSLRFGTDEVEIDTFGLVPSHVGRGLGGPFLQLATEIAWEGCSGARRVWLQTSSHDDPRALGNYRTHGFRVYKTVVPDHS